jgi:hypothetical protein
MHLPDSFRPFEFHKGFFLDENGIIACMGFDKVKISYFCAIQC